MDSRTINGEIRRHIRPVLKTAGFTEFTDRTARRYAAGRAEVLNFQSFNSYTAAGIGCTTYSFAVNLGTYLAGIRDPYAEHGIRRKGGPERPEEYQCHFRRRLSRGFPQPELERRDTWYIDPRGRYLARAMDDVRAVVLTTALPWWERLRDPERVLDILLHDPERDDLWGFGANPSPIRSYLTAYAAVALGQFDLAQSKLNEARRSGCFQMDADMCAGDILAR